MTSKDINRKRRAVLISRHCHFFIFLIISVLGFCGMVHAESDVKIRVGEFSRGVMDGWKPKKFENTTNYELVKIEDKNVLKAVSQRSASGLVRKIRVDLDKTPILNWQWRIENRLDGKYDERTKTGDDYAARIYVIVSGGWAIWNTKAVNYVWAKHVPKGEIWPNAYAKENAAMIAVRSSGDPVSAWRTEKRNIKEDFHACFGENIRFIDAVALMSDTDNTQNEAVAVYGDIYFSAQ